MLTRRQFLERTLQGSSLVALSSVVPGFLANTARAAEPGKDNILVVLEMTGGNDGLNTIAPYADDLYHKARPTLGLKKDQVIRIDDYHGLHPALRSLEGLLGKKQLAMVQGVGYPNPDRSHFESMDIWHSADPKRQTGNGWLGRSMAYLKIPEGHIPAVHVSTDKLPLALQGSAVGVPSIHPSKPYDLNLGGERGHRHDLPELAPPPAHQGKEKPTSEPDPEEKQRAARRKIIQELAELPPAPPDSLLQFVKRSELQTYATIDRLREITRMNPNESRPPQIGGRAIRYGALAQNLTLVARMIQAGFGTRIYYVEIANFDTHSSQANAHPELLREAADAIANFFTLLEGSGNAKRVLLMTFSEFGRTFRENGSKGTDHGAGSCLFVAGPAVQGGLVGKHPSMAKEDLDGGDLKHHADFRRVYATLLDRWLECDSQKVLGGKFEHVALLR